jgi:hypothetical protein
MDSPVLVCLFEDTLINATMTKYLSSYISAYTLFQDLLLEHSTAQPYRQHSAFNNKPHATARVCVKRINTL